MTSPPSFSHLLVDAHVHLHDCFDLAQFLEAARSNFQQQSRQLGLIGSTIGILLLTEVQGVCAFSHLVNQRNQLNQALADWEIFPTAEAVSLRFVHTSGQTLLIMAGRQVVTQEGIEVLTLVTESTVEDGLSLEDTVKAAIAANSLPVLPWGVGKWIGQRGQRVQACLAEKSQLLFAGDNGGRPGFWALPSFCAQHRLLPGSDPLPLADEVTRPGSFGFAVLAPPDWDNQMATPGDALKQILRSPDSDLQTYGRSQSFWRFLKNQSLLRMS